MNKRRLWFLLACLLILAAVVACVCLLPRGEEPPVTAENGDNVGALLSDLVRAYETPQADDAARIEADLQTIGKINGKDEKLARSIAEHWQKTWLDPDYPLYNYAGEETAECLLDSGIPDSAAHAIVVLGFELADGQMQDELKGRCEAAAAVARAFPKTILVCSGGATGANNPEGHTEAGLMKDYLVEVCGLDGARIFIDEEAMTTAENAVNTFRILREQGVKTITVVTSAYHQLWGQAVYQAMAARVERQEGYHVDIIANYSYPIGTDVAAFRSGDRIAVMQMASILELPSSATRNLTPSGPAKPAQQEENK